MPFTARQAPRTWIDVPVLFGRSYWATWQEDKVTDEVSRLHLEAAKRQHLFALTVRGTMELQGIKSVATLAERASMTENGLRALLRGEVLLHTLHIVMLEDALNTTLFPSLEAAETNADKTAHLQQTRNRDFSESRRRDGLA